MMYKLLTWKEREKETTKTTNNIHDTQTIYTLLTYKGKTTKTTKSLAAKRWRREENQSIIQSFK